MLEVGPAFCELLTLFIPFPLAVVFWDCEKMDSCCCEGNKLVFPKRVDMLTA